MEWNLETKVDLLFALCGVLGVFLILLWSRYARLTHTLHELRGAESTSSIRLNQNWDSVEQAFAELEDKLDYLQERGLAIKEEAEATILKLRADIRSAMDDLDS